MLRIYLITLLSLVFLSVSAQPSKLQGVVTYKVMPVDQAEQATNQELAIAGFSPSPHMKKIMDQMKFTLNFTEQQSGFDLDSKKIKGSDDDLFTTKIAIGFSRYKWQDNQNAYSQTKAGIKKDAPDALLYNDKSTLKWTITDESKIIGGFTCFKATANEILEHPNKKFIKPIVAWFTPEIPVPFGPLHYGNLPGLILELQTEKALFGAEKIDFKKTPVIKELPKLPKYTEMELLKIVNSK